MFILANTGFRNNLIFNINVHISKHRHHTHSDFEMKCHKFLAEYFALFEIFGLIWGYLE